MAKSRIVRAAPSQAVLAAVRAYADRESTTYIGDLVKAAIARWSLRNWTSVGSYIIATTPTVYRTVGDRGCGYDDTIVQVPCIRIGNRSQLFMNPDGEILEEREPYRLVIVDLHSLSKARRDDLIADLEFFR